eukprot:CAMPEP_0172318164 /NCGR_PEP_ID=MMETSP1058-20130122/34019_1 /TAXON_ID=83371 /ORGANISM="Detonula confervacea, Strain CCMP 353" /LENGTH=191 /DNA_ID=CAMNT_0013032915 /DNA_START=169 /DNA_END=741 /DNA_ORIENTATION=-
MMRQPIRQISHITGANTNQPKSRRKCTREPIRLFVGLSLIWIIVFVTKFYSDQPQQPLQSRKDVSPNHNNTESNRPQQQEQELSDNNLVPNLRLNALDINNVDIISGSNDTQLNNGNNDFPEHYMVFSTDCTAYQDWQALVFFYNAHKVQQPGHVIRIASGCNPKQREKLTKFHETKMSKLSSKFSVHFTP